MKIIIAGGGASGVFAALQCRKKNRSAQITVLEKSDCLLAKVLLSGGGRCNLSHSVEKNCDFFANYPRGRHFLRKAFFHFGPVETHAWFTSRGIQLKTEADGRIFPVSDSASTIADSLIDGLRRGGITVRFNSGLRSVTTSGSAPFRCILDDGTALDCDRLCIATGGNRGGQLTPVLSELGHRVIAPVPSLFSFAVSDARIASIPGITVEDVALSIPKSRFSERGPLLITHQGLSGLSVLRISSFAARYLYEQEYRFNLIVDWCPSMEHQELFALIKSLRTSDPRTAVFSRSPLPLPLRLWQSLCSAAGCTVTQRRADLTKQQASDLTGLIHKSIFTVSGINTNKSEFVTCGGVALKEVNPQTMCSRHRNGLYFSGEVLDIDGVTGGYNLQAAWTTGWIAGEELGKTV